MSSLVERLQALVGDAYRVERELPLGGMSRLWVAHDVAVGRDVVLKVLPPDLACAASTVRFRREVELTAQLLHPNIVPVLSAGGAGDVVYYVTPFVAGESLRELIAREGALPFEAVLRVLDDVLGALAYAHSRGVVHRDVKPGNILLPADGRAMLADFGIASALSVADATGSEGTPGTPAYMAPEHPTDARADLWATCVVAHEMLTGARPAPGVAAAEIARARARALGAREARRAEALAAVVARGLSLTPARRWPSAAALQSAVARARERRWPTRRLLGGLTGALALAAMGFAATQSWLDAARARERGRAAEARFELDRAIGAYREALTHDSSDVGSRLGLARALVWRGGATDLANGIQNLRTLLTSSTSLTSDAREHAAALLALAERRYPHACGAFDALVRRDTIDAEAWIGLAECRRRDDVLVADTSAPEALVFRTGFHGAADAYERALDLRPAAAGLYARLARVLIIETNRQRGGRLLQDTSVRRHAYPQLEHDTLAFRLARESGPAAVPATRNAAIEANLHRLRRRLSLWVRYSDEEPAAHRELSSVLEASGFLMQPDLEDRSALQEIRRARALTPPDSTLPLIQAEVRQLVKAGEWLKAERLGDSALSRWSGATASDADHLLGIAALLGRAQRLDGLLRMTAATRKQRARLADNREVEVHPSLMLARARFVAAASLLNCPQLPPRKAALEEAIAAYLLPSSERTMIANSLLERPASLAVPCVGAAGTLAYSGSHDALLRLQAAAARGSRAAVHRLMDSVRATRAYDRPGDAAMDYAFHEAWVLLLVGDSSEALTRLDEALDALPASGPYVLSELSGSVESWRE